MGFSIAFLLCMGAGNALAQDGNSPTEPVAETAAETAPPAQDAPATGAAQAPPERRAAGTWEEPALPADVMQVVAPDFSAQDLAWISAVVIALLALRSRPSFSMQNLDALMLIASAFLLLGRTDTLPFLDPEARSVQWWSYALLSVIGVYWLVRGVALTLSHRGAAPAAGLPRIPLVILLVLGVGSLAYRIAVDPVSEDSLDGVSGGAFLVRSGHLPYGDNVRSDERSPLLYLAHAGAVQLVPPNGLTRDGDTPEGYALRVAGAPQEELNAARLVNIALLALTIGALLVIGFRSRCGYLAMTLVALFCFLPGVRECVTHPGWMLPTTLVAWAAAFTFVPGVGGLLAGVTTVLAGLALPVAWLMTPAVLGYYCRRGVQGVACALGILVGLAGIVYGIPTLVDPALPRANRSLAAAGRAPAYMLRADGEAVILDSAAPASAPAEGRMSFAWKYLLDQERTSLADTELAVTSAPDLDPAQVLIADLDASGFARAQAQKHYRGTLESAGFAERFWPATRTLLESTALARPAEPLDAPAPWGVWSADDAYATTIGRMQTGAKIFAIVMALGVAVLLLRRRDAQPHHLIGGLLAVAITAALASGAGVVWNQAWWLVLVVALFAGTRAGAARPPQREVVAPNVAPPPAPRGAAPRISVEN